MKKSEDIRKRISYSTDFYKLLLTISKVDVADIFLSLTAKYINLPLQPFQNERAKCLFDVLCNDYDTAYDMTHAAAQARGHKGGMKKAENRRKREAERQQHPESFKEAASEDDGVPLVETEEVEQYPFELFWCVYVSHKDEKNARNIWAHLYDDSRKKAIDGAKIYAQYVSARKAKDPNFDAILKPSTYLKDAHWNDEYKEEELTPQNYGNNNRQYNSRELAMQQNDAKCLNIMSEALANIKPYGTADTGPVAIGTDGIL